ELLVGEAVGAEGLGAGGLEVVHVVGVVDDAHRVALAVADAVLVDESERGEGRRVKRLRRIRHRAVRMCRCQRYMMRDAPQEESRIMYLAAGYPDIGRRNRCQTAWLHFTPHPSDFATSP